jgi:hypothetical protein
MIDLPPRPLTALSPEYIEALRERDEPPGATDGDLAGHWRVRERDGEFHVFREWERFETGHRPAASLKHREDALFLVMALEIAGKPAIFRFHGGGELVGEGYSLEREGEAAGTLRMYRAELLVILHTLASVVRSPVDLSTLLSLSGSLLQEMIGEILGQEILGEPTATPGEGSATQGKGSATQGKGSATRGE